MVRDTSSSCKIDYVAQAYGLPNPVGHQNCIIYSKVTPILLKWVDFACWLSCIGQGNLLQPISGKPWPSTSVHFSSSLETEGLGSGACLPTLQTMNIRWPGFNTNCTELYSTALVYIELHCTALYWTVLHCTVLHCTVLNCTVDHLYDSHTRWVIRGRKTLSGPINGQWSVVSRWLQLLRQTVTATATPLLY